jgi:eukaryotic-like serine/threonine-protein kinase
MWFQVEVGQLARLARTAVGWVSALCTWLAAWLTTGALQFGRSASGERRQAGSYDLVQRIAAGGMGEIWLARHAMLNRPAAVKVIQREMLARASFWRSRSLLQDFEHEARCTAALHSPHTVQLYDFGRTPEGDLFYAMELLGGMNLEELVRRFGPLPAGRVICLLRQVCRSLAEAHAVGMVHRDIKPANLQVTLRGGEVDFVKVLDFGLVVQSVEGTASRVGPARGTPAYIAPESIQHGTAVDARADLYSLGCVAYELLTGHLVFEGLGDREMVEAHLHQAPLSPTQRWRVPIPGELERLVMTLLEKDPSRRPGSAAEVEAWLARIASEHPWTRAQASEWWSTALPGAWKPLAVRSTAQVQAARNDSGERPTVRIRAAHG